MGREAATHTAIIQAQVSSILGFQPDKPLILLQAVRPLMIEEHGGQADIRGDEHRYHGRRLNLLHCI